MRERHLVFVVSELDEVLPGGGAGAVVAALARALRDRGVRVTVVLATADTIPPTEGVIVARVDPDAADSPHLARSEAAATALAKLLTQEEVDLVEFQDFDGLGFWALARRAALGLTAVPIVVRYHLPADHILDAVGVDRPDLAAVRVLERSALRMADAVIVQTRTMADVVVQRYGLAQDRVLLGQPPIPSIGRVQVGRDPTPRLVVFGRLAEQKGSHDALRALLPLLEDHPEAVLEFVGSDGWSDAAGTTMRQWMESTIPPRLTTRVRFTGSIDRTRLPEHLAGTWMVIIPTRLESFCLAAHEARAMGLPLVARNEPAIADAFSEHVGAVLYDGSDEELRAAVDGLLRSPDRLDELAGSPLPKYDDPLLPYLQHLPTPRHPQSQAGLATEAVHLLEAQLATDTKPVAKAAQALLRAMPKPLGQLAVRIVPSRLKDRFRSVASWPTEQARRERRSRRAAVRRRIAAGDFPELDQPQVSVVIACFNQGDFLLDALVSVFEQSKPSWEVIVVNDGSDDPETLRILDRLDWPRVRVLHKANAGLPAARNTGIEAARGEYVVPLDSDDELAPIYLERMITALASRPDAAYAHCWAELFGDVECVWATRPYNPYLELISNGVVGCVLLRRSAWEAVGGYDVTMTEGNEDWELWVRLQGVGWSNVQVPEPLFRYRRRGLSMSVTTEGRFEEGRLAIATRHPALYQEAALRRLKLEHFPLVSIILPAEGELPPSTALFDDAEVVVRGPSSPDMRRSVALRGVPLRESGFTWCEAVRAAQGKYVVAWPGSDATAQVFPLIDQLERDAASSAATDGVVTVHRRWALVDRSAPHPHSGECPDDAYVTPTAITVRSRKLPVLRQPPEVEGRLPGWTDQ